jgi:hypothetical protein
MKIKFNNSSDFGTPGALPPYLQKILNAAEAIPDSEVVDFYGMAAMAGVASSTVGHCSGHPAFKGNRHVCKHKAWWGNKRTIAELKKQFS